MIFKELKLNTEHFIYYWTWRKYQTASCLSHLAMRIRFAHPPKLHQIFQLCTCRCIIWIHTLQLLYTIHTDKYVIILYRSVCTIHAHLSCVFWKFATVDVSDTVFSINAIKYLPRSGIVFRSVQWYQLDIYNHVAPFTVYMFYRSL